MGEIMHVAVAEGQSLGGVVAGGAAVWLTRLDGQTVGVGEGVVAKYPGLRTCGGCRGL